VQFAKTIVFNVLLVLWTALLAPLIPYLAITNRPEKTRLWSRIWSRGILVGLRHVVGLRHREIGTENKLERPCIYACNHQSAWEALVFNTFVPDVAIVLKDSLYRIPVFGWFLRHSPMIAIDRAAGAAAMRKILRDARSALAEGRSVLIFPEGSRQPVYEKSVFQPGVSLLYRALGVPVVPVAVNSGVFWNSDGAMKYDGEITVSYLEPINPGLNVDEFSQKLRSAICTEKDRIVRELDIDLWLEAQG
jgi:1-acyl-sn-glycerol-3-phosphate acyltransferase